MLIFKDIIRTERIRFQLGKSISLEELTQLEQSQQIIIEIIIIRYGRIDGISLLECE